MITIISFLLILTVHPGSAPTVTYAFQTPPPAGSQQSLGKMAMHGQLIYSTPAGEYYHQQSPSAISPVTAYPQPVDVNGGLGPQRGAIYAQPSKANTYHPYMRFSQQ